MNEQIIPTQLDLFLKQENRFYMNAQATKRNRFMLKVYLETLVNHPSNNPYEQLLIQTVKSRQAQAVQDRLLQRILKIIVNDTSPNPPLSLHNEFEEIALEWNYKRLEERADILVSMPIESVRDPLVMMLGSQIITRKGISTEPGETFIAADPLEVKRMISQHPKQITSEQIQYWLTDCSGRAIDYLKARNSQNASA
jgi:hypothetical protein